MPDAQPAATNALIPLASDGFLSGAAGDLAIRGVVWTATGYGASQVLRFGFNLALTRLLVPELFGLMTLVFTIMNGLQLFCDVGIAPAVIRNLRGDESVFVNTAWTLQVIRGFLIACGEVLLAHPMASFYGDDRLRQVLPLVGLTSFISGFNSSSLMRLQRHLRVSRLMTVEVSTQLVAGVVMVLWAWRQPGMGALVSGPIVAAVLRVIWSHRLMPEHPVRPSLDRAAARELLRFGAWIWVASVLTFLASQIDRLILGKLFSLRLLGIYGVALAISEFPRGLAFAMSNHVLFPTYSKSGHLPRPDLRAIIERHRTPLLLLIGCTVAALVTFGDGILRTLYDKRYAEDAWMLPMLAFGLWPTAMAHTVDSALFIVGRPAYAAIGNFLKLLFTAIGVPLAFWTWGVPGAVIVVALNDLFYYLPIAYGLRREGLSSLHQDLKSTAVLLGVLAFTLMLRWALGGGVPIRGAF